MTIKNKIVIISFILLFLIIIGITLMYYGLHKILIARNEARIALTIQAKFQDLRISFEQTLMAPHDYLIIGDKDKKEKILKEDFKNLYMKKDYVKNLIINEKGRHGLEFENALGMAEKRFLKIEQDLPRFEEIALSILEIENPFVNTNAGRHMKKMDELVRGLEGELKIEGELLAELSQKAVAHADDLHAKGEKLLILIGFCGLFIGIIISIYVVKSITEPIGDLLQATRKITAGDLTARANAEANDEIGELARSFNKMLRELIIAQERMLNIFQGTGDSMRVIDKDFNVLQVNKEMERLTGVSSAESVGKKCYEHFCGNFCHTERCSLMRILDGEDLIETETVKKTISGNKVPVELIATPLKREGEIVGVIESFRNITKRKLTEYALRESELRLKTIVDSVQIGILIIDKDKHTIFDTNPTAIQMIGTTKSELIGADYGEYIFDLPVEECDSGDKGSNNKSSESQLKRKNGEMVPILKSHSNITLNGRDYTIESFIDITERKRVEEAIRQTKIAKAERERIFSLLELLPAFVYLLSSDYSIPFANKKFREVFGDPGGKYCYEIFYGLNAPCEECQTFQVFEKKDVIKREWEGMDGKTYEFYDCPFTDIDGSPLALELGIDITDRKKAEAEKKEAERKLEEQRARAILSDRLRSLGEMASGMAHELNQPLMGVRGLAEHILIGLNRGWNFSEENIKEKIEMIIGQADRMTHVIDHARTFARGADTSELLHVQVNEVIKAGISLIGTQLRSRGIILKLDMSDYLPNVYANPFSLEEVILNLVNNARDALIENSAKGIQKEPPHIIICTRIYKKAKKSFVKIQVTDKGAGIPKQILPRVFEPFFTTKDPEKGTGLGLAISKSIIERFNGKIDVKSMQDSGTTVTISLPAA